nr:GHKL domain-containing protein [bacterium]
QSTLNIVWNEIKYKAEVSSDYGELPLVTCHPQQLNQVFMNLLVNASQAIEKDGIITITTREDNGFVKISISDNGSGIEESKIVKIFDPFYTTKPVGQGTGLGLSISNEIIQQHGGTITVESEPGKGTTFIIAIPVN